MVNWGYGPHNSIYTDRDRGRNLVLFLLVVLGKHLLKNFPTVLLTQIIPGGQRPFKKNSLLELLIIHPY